MKIGIDARTLCSEYPTGIGRYTLEMCRGLYRMEGVKLYLYSPVPIMKEIKTEFKFSVFREHTCGNGFLKQIWGETYLPRWAKRDSVDIFWGPSHRLPRFLSNKIARVITIHDLVWLYAGDTMRPLSRCLEYCQMPAGIRVADRVVAVSKSTAGAVIQEFRLSSDKIDVILLGVSSDSNTESFGVLDQFDISNSYILFVGTLEPRKNLRRLLISYSRLSDTLKSDVKLVIVGGKGWGGVDVTDMVSELDLEDYVQVLGYVDDSLLPTLYAHALFLAMPSLYEGFGLPLVEAMIQGTPVLTSNNSSMPEVAGDAGLMIDPLDVCSINNGLEELIMNHELRNQLSENARSNVVRFSWDVAAEQLVAVFEKAIDGKDSRN